MFFKSAMDDERYTASVVAMILDPPRKLASPTHWLYAMRVRFTISVPCPRRVQKGRSM
jgi:hypothetical protein